MIPDSTPRQNDQQPPDGATFDRAAAVAAMLPMVEGKPRAMVALAQQMLTAGDRVGAARLCLRAIDDPGCPAEARVRASELLSAEIPRWHFVIVRDEVRNKAYEDALHRAIFPGCTVLEIGTGTGLLAMMAARLGARVVTCEADPVVALAAERVIARNGLSDRIRVIPCHSTKLDAEADLGGRADILVSEIVSNDLIGEGVFPAMEHAVEHLLVRNAAIIPARGRVRIALADFLGAPAPLDAPVSDFDLSPFNCLAKPFRELPVGDPNIAFRSDALDLFSFDFASGAYTPPQSIVTAVESSGGKVGGTIQWIMLEMDDEIRYENRPSRNAISCWSAIYRPFIDALQTMPRDRVGIGAGHDRDSLSLWNSNGF